MIHVNVHPIERVVRVVAGLGLLSQVFFGLQSPWFWIGIVPILTGLSGWCPPYSLLGISTCRTKTSK
jgi:hypothetical protein